MAKKNFIINLFNDIAPSYDKLNHILSLNIDKRWRAKAVKKIISQDPYEVLDIACGTGDFSLAICEAGVQRVVGVDISEKMLEIAKKKAKAVGLTMTWQIEDCEHLSFETSTYDGISVAFGVRNFEHLEQGLSEMVRVLRPNGQLCILELSVPDNAFLRGIYKIYFLHILPFIGGLVSGNKAAYRYLPISVMNFPKPDEVCQKLRDAGLVHVYVESFTFGLCRMYIGYKRDEE